MGLKYDMFAVNIYTEELYDMFMENTTLKDFTPLMEDYREWMKEHNRRLEELKDMKDSISKEEYKDRWEELIFEEPEDRELRKYYRATQNLEREFKKVTIWWKDVPDYGQWTFGGYSGIRGWMSAFTNEFERAVVQNLLEAGVKEIYLLNYHHNEDAGGVIKIWESEGELLSSNMGSKDHELFEFKELFAPRVKRAWGLPLPTIHERLDTPKRIDWDYEVGRWVDEED